MWRRFTKFLRQSFWLLLARLMLLIAACLMTHGAAAEAALQTTANAQAAVQSLSLQLGRCGGYCPVYRVVVYASGEVHYFADVTSAKPTATKYISTVDWQRILDAFNESHFDRLQPEYTRQAHGCRALRTDASTLRIALVKTNGSQSLVFYAGCEMAERATILWLVDTIATVSGARDWWRAHQAQQHGRKQVE